MEKNNQEKNKNSETKKKREEQLLYLFRQDPRLKLMIKRAEKNKIKKKEDN